MTKQIDKFEGLRIYTVVPGTVQTPIKVTYKPRKVKSSDGRTQEIYSFGRFENTRDIVQPAGRQAQQVGHVARKLERTLLLEEIAKHRRGKQTLDSLRRDFPYHAITGITKACRDSFELLHVKRLLEAADIRYFEFHDDQEDLYEDVVTAIATEPVTPFAVAGILDYLPLWTGK
jgi:hypothetical protein